MKGWKGRTALAVAGVMMLSCSMNVAAAGVRDVFDAEYYADSYADLKEAFGNDAEALLQHYVTCGLSEGRSGSKVFDVAEYRNAYPDLDAAFGDNWDAYVNHYVTFGITEGRTVGVYGEIDLSKINSSDEDVQKDAAENTNEKTNENTEESVAGEVYLNLGESADVAISVKGIAEPVHVKVTFVDMEYEGDETGVAEKDGGHVPANYSSYLYTLRVEGDPSIDWSAYRFTWTPDLDTVEINYRDWHSWTDRSWIFTVDMGELAYDGCSLGVGWDSFDLDTTSWTFYYRIGMPSEKKFGRLVKYVLPKFIFRGAEDKTIYLKAE